ncbi:TIGR03557 family F420-dependent LLM class oxidoreductase [Microbispora hainanensis]|uniref:TIGR03557 family F420-dependent LLM class oxidoreductase n=1 Tax=Microbispora hainanensis TaxID=568844 RepID=UPI0033F4C481
MTTFGYFLSSEEHDSKELVRQAKLAEEAGFEVLWISDHFHPWLDEQGESSFVWSVIGAVSQATSLPVTTAVTCPIIRVHPAIIAQAAATAQTLLDGGFRLGVGAGEALNEHILGDQWPPAERRQRMLEEAVDGYIHTAPAADMVEAFHKAGGEGRPCVAGLKVCWANDEAEARKTVHRLWPNQGIPGEAAQLLPLPRHFEQLAQFVTEEAATRSTPCGPSPEAHLSAIRAHVDAGFDEVYIAQIGTEQEGFFEFYSTRILPRLRERRSRELS